MQLEKVNVSMRGIDKEKINLVTLYLLQDAGDGGQ